MGRSSQIASSVISSSLVVFVFFLSVLVISGGLHLHVGVGGLSLVDFLVFVVFVIFAGLDVYVGVDGRFLLCLASPC